MSKGQWKQRYTLMISGIPSVSVSSQSQLVPLANLHLFISHPLVFLSVCLSKAAGSCLSVPLSYR